MLEDKVEVRKQNKKKMHNRKEECTKIRGEPGGSTSEFQR